jgi:hypothetical protein
MDGSRFIDVLRQTRDHGLSFVDSLNARSERADVWAIPFLERAIGDDILCILSACAMDANTHTVWIHFRKEKRKKDVRCYIDFLCDELEWNGFDTEYLTYSSDRHDIILCVPLCTDQDEQDLSTEGCFDELQT